MTAPARRITWTLYVEYADGSRSLLDMLDWEPGYDSTAKQAWRYAWRVFRAAMHGPRELGGVRVFWTVTGR